MYVNYAIIGAMTDRLPSTEIPQSHWAAIAAVRYTSEDMLATMDALSAVEREDDMPYLLMLGGIGVALATQVRLYGGLGELTDPVGGKVDDKRQDPRWLFPEIMAIMERRAAQ